MEEKRNSQTVQQARVSDREKNLLRGTFSENENLLLALRNLFFGFELDEVEQRLVEKLKGAEIRKLLRKIFLPELEKDIPIGQSVDLWMTIKIEDKEDVGSIIAGRELLISMLEKGLKLLEGKGEKNDLNIRQKELKELNRAYFLARNTFISHVELQLAVIRMLANSVEETPQQLMDRIKADSAK